MNIFDSKSKARQVGFTLIELVVALAVMSLLAALMTPNIIEEINLRRADLTVQDTQAVLDAARSYRSDVGIWPGGGGCAAAVSTLRSSGYLPAGPTSNRYNQAVETSCTAQAFSVVQRAIPDWDGYLVNGLPGTTISNLGLSQITSTIGIPGSEPAMANKLSRVWTGNHEDNRMRAELLLGNNRILEAGNMHFSVAHPYIHADSGSLHFSAQSGYVQVAPHNTLVVDDIIVRSRGNRRLSDSMPNYIQVGTYIVRNGWYVNKPACHNGGIAKAALRPAAIRGGYTGPAGNDNTLVGQFGFQYRTIDVGWGWYIEAVAEGWASDYNHLDSLIDVYCHYWS